MGLSGTGSLVHVRAFQVVDVDVEDDEDDLPLPRASQATQEVQPVAGSFLDPTFQVRGGRA